MAKRMQSHKLSMMFSLLNILTLTLTVIFSSLLFLLLFKTGLLAEQNRPIALFIVAVVSIVVGTVISKFVGRRPLAAIVAISEAAKEVAKGNFTVALKEDIQIRELQELSRNFNRMTRELAGTELLRTDFIENVSHELKTPLAAIEGYATLLQRKNLPEDKQEEYTGKILYNTKRLSALTSNILLLSRLENQELDIPKEPFCLDEQIREVILSQEQNWTEKGLRLDIDLDSADCQGSKDLLAHVWQNLLNNAVKFAPYGGTIHILLCREKENLKIMFEDNGPGMSEEVRLRVFEKFYQGDPSRSSQGSGLGLALAKRIVDLHGGEILASSKEGAGTVFTVSLPVNARSEKERKNDII